MFRRVQVDPRRTNTFLDSCAFDPKDSLESAAAARLLALRREGKVSVVIAHSTQKEVDHPNTPPDVKAEAGDMIYTIEASLTPSEIARRERVRAIVIGDGKPEKYMADANHVFEAGKYHGFFVTTDNRILSRREELKTASRAVILKPTEWLEAYDGTADA